MRTLGFYTLLLHSLRTTKTNLTADLAHWNEHIHFYTNPQNSGITSLLDKLFMQNNSTASPSMLAGYIQNKIKNYRHVTDRKVLCT